MFSSCFRHIFRRVFGQTETHISRVMEASEDFDPRRWGFRHLYILHSQTVAIRGVKTYVDRSADRPKVMFDVPKVISEMPKPPPTHKRGGCQTYIFAGKNICFGCSKHMFKGV